MEELTEEEKMLVLDYRRGYRGVFFHLDDFEARATSNEEFQGNSLYDKTKFAETFQKMFDQHDMNEGICWLTMDTYLNTYCLFD